MGTHPIGVHVGPGLTEDNELLDGGPLGLAAQMDADAVQIFLTDPQSYATPKPRPDADALLAGDLVEESAPPYYNDDCWPMDWPLSLDIVLGLTTPASVVVPGHGATVDREFVEVQRNEIGIVAETIRDLAGRGVPLDQALEAGEWPYPAEGLAAAVARGYEQLPRSQKRLPLV